MNLHFPSLLPGEIWRRLRADRYRRRLLVAWVSYAVFELCLTATDIARISWVEGAVEFGALTMIGLLHATLAADDWRGSAAWPGAIGSTLVMIRLTAEGVCLAFDTAILLVPFAGLAVVFVTYYAVRLLDRAVWRRIPAVLLSAVGPLVLRLLMLGPLQVSQPLRPMPEPTTDDPPIVVITVDTLRSDAAAQMESVRLLGERGATWPRAMASSSWTWPSIVSLWSGVAAETHGSGRVPALLQKLKAWQADLPWLPRELHDAGYVRAAFVTNPILLLMPIASSFDRWYHGSVVRVPLALVGFPGDSSDGGDARDVVDAAIDWLEGAPARGFLLWVHLSEPHVPYRHATERRYDLNVLRTIKMGHWFLLPDEREAMRRAYRAEVAYADAHIVRLIRALESRGHFDDGIVVLASDHGEELWEHEGFEHGHSHHGEVIDVPLVLVAPGVEPGERKGLAALEDVAPTLRALVGLPWEGVDLRQPIPDGRVARAFGNMYYRPMRSARVGATRVIVDGDQIRAYDLRADPGEHAPRIMTAAQLEALVGPRRIAEDAPPREEIDIEGDVLRALGYVD